MVKTTIVLADDHAFLRQAVRALLEVEPDLSVAAEAADGLQAAELVNRLKPDVLITDVMMPGLSGLEVVRLARQSSPKTRTIILSMYATKAYVVEGLRVGAVGYVLKDSCADDLVSAVRQATKEHPYLGLLLSRQAMGV